MDIKSPLKEKLKGNYAFIDSQNLNLGVKSMGWELDFAKFRNFLSDSYGVSEAYIFIGKVNRYKKLYIKLKKYGYKIIFKPTLGYRGHGSIQTKGNVDAEMVLHTMIEWENYNKAIVVSGDGDFYCLIEHLQRNNKLLKIIVPNHKYSTLLRRFGQSILLISNVKIKVEK